MIFLKQSSTAQELIFFMALSSDGKTGATGLSPTVTIRKASGSFGSPSGAVSEIANGFYKVAGNATDTNTLGPLLLHATGTGADPADKEFNVVAFDPQDATRFGLSSLPNANANANGGLPILSSSATTLNYTIPTVTTVATTTTLTNAPQDSSGVTTLLTRIPGLLRFVDFVRLITGATGLRAVWNTIGDDLTGAANTYSTPYETITAAKAAAQHGELIQILGSATPYVESNIEADSANAFWICHGTIVAPADNSAPAWYADGDGAWIFGSGMIDAPANGVGYSANDAISVVEGITIRATASGSKAVSQGGAGTVVLRNVSINSFGNSGVTDPQDLFQADNGELEKITLDSVAISYNVDVANATGIFVFGGNPNTFDLSNGVGTTVLNGSSVTDIREELDDNSTKLANLDATVSSRLPTSSYTAPDNSGIGTAATQATAAATSAATAATQSTSAATSAAAIAAKLPSKSKLAGTDNSDGDIQLNEATGAFTEAALENTPSSSGGTVGAGADEVTLTITSSGDPVADADVWISSDSAGAHVVAGTLQTNSSGQVTFLLDAGVTYYLWMQKDGQNPIRGQSFVAVAD